jgi:hypothetical protein
LIGCLEKTSYGTKILLDEVDERCCIEAHYASA